MTLCYGSDANVILSREDGEGSQAAQDDAFLRQRLNQFPVLRLGERARGPRADVSGGTERQSELRGRLVIGQISDNHDVVLAHDQIEILDLAARRFVALLRMIESSRTLFDLLQPLLRVLNEGNVGGHLAPPLLRRRDLTRKR